MCVFDIIRSNRASSSTSAEIYILKVFVTFLASPSGSLCSTQHTLYKAPTYRHTEAPCLVWQRVVAPPSCPVMPPTSNSTRFHSHTNTTRGQELLLLGYCIPMNGSIFCADSTIFTMDRAHHQAQTLLLLLLASCIPEKPACVSPRKLLEQQYRLGRLVQLWKSNVVDAHSTRNLAPRNILIPLCTSCYHCCLVPTCTSVSPVVYRLNTQ